MGIGCGVSTILRNVFVLKCSTRQELFVWFKQSVSWNFLNSKPPQPPQLLTIPQRYYHKDRGGHGTENPFLSKHSKDNVPEDYFVIHQNQNTNYIRSLALLVPISILVYAASVIWYLNYEKESLRNASQGTESTSQEREVPKEKTKVSKGGPDTLSHYEVFKLASIGSVGWTICLIVARRAYRLSMIRVYKHRNSNKYIGILPKWFVFSKQFPFCIQDVQRNTGRRLLGDDVKIRNRPFILAKEDFALPVYYNELHLFEDTREPFGTKKSRKD